jgi:hypothetical protein
MAKGKKTATNQEPTAVAARVSGTVGRTRSGRDSITRVGKAIKVVDTQARQWNRYTP